MEIRTIKAETITDTVEKLFKDLNYNIGNDISEALCNAQKNEESPVGKAVIAQLLENNKIAAEEKIPICQDTGMAVLLLNMAKELLLMAILKKLLRRVSAEHILVDI